MSLGGTGLCERSVQQRMSRYGRRGGTQRLPSTSTDAVTCSTGLATHILYKGIGGVKVKINLFTDVIIKS